MILIKIEDNSSGKAIIAQPSEKDNAARTILLIPGLLFLWWGTRFLPEFVIELSKKPPEGIASIIFFSILCLVLLPYSSLVVLGCIYSGISGLIGSSSKALFQGDKLILSQTLGKYDIYKKTYDLKKLKDIRIQENPSKLRYWSRKTEYIIIFDYAGTEKNLLRDLTKDQAEMLLKGPLQQFCAPSCPVP